jgi:hypothetical protein
VRCGQCGASLGEGDRFCGDCGANVGGCPSCGDPLIPASGSAGRAAWLPGLAARSGVVTGEVAVTLSAANQGMVAVAARVDYAEYLTRDGDPDAAAQAVVEARDIARRLRCQPVLDRADALDEAPSAPAPAHS